MLILKYAKNYFTAVLRAFSLLVLRSNGAVRNFLPPPVPCHSGHVTSEESADHRSVAGLKSGRERGLWGTTWTVATETCVGNSRNISECLVSKPLLPEYCCSIDQAAALPLGSRKLAAEPISSSISHSGIFLMQKSLHLFWGMLHKTVIPTSLKFSLVLVYGNSATAVLGSTTWIVLQACLRIPAGYSFPCS